MRPPKNTADRVVLLFARFVPLLVMVVLVSSILLAELNRLISDVATYGVTHSMNSVLGPLSFLEGPAWQDWADASSPPVDLVGLHIAVDIVFYVSYCLLAWRLAGRTLIGQVLIEIVFGAEVLESVVLTGLNSSVSADAVPGWLVIVEYVLASGKWLALIVLVVYILLSPTLRDVWWDPLISAARAVFAQGLVTVVVGFLAFMAVIPGAGVLEQIPDAQRAWIRSEPGESSGIDVPGLLGAAVAFAVLALVVFFISRLRAQQFVSDPSNDDRVVIYLPWILLVAVLVLAAAIVRGARPDLVDVSVTGTLASIILGLVITSVILRVCRAELLGDRTVSRPAAASVRTAGDVLVCLLLAFSALGLVRSFSAPLFVELYDGSIDDEALVWVRAFFTLGVILSITVFPISRRILRNRQERVQPGARRSLVTRALDTSVDSSDDLDIRLATAAVAVLGAFGFAQFLFRPEQWSELLSAVGTLTALLACWAAMLGAVIVMLSRTRPLEVFRLVGLRTTPFLALLVVIPVLVSQVTTTLPLHSIESDSGDAPHGQRQDLRATFYDWLSRGDGCDVMRGGQLVRPLVLVAAEGGGIRAATWTQDVFATLVADGACGDSAVLLSSGVSGGSLGLTITKTDDRDIPTGVDEPIQIADSHERSDAALALGIAGLFAGDQFAAITGIRVPTEPGYSSRDREWDWQDRAAHIQSSWIESYRGLGESYDLSVTGPTGALVINSSDALSRCKVIVSQVDLHVESTTSGDPECEGNTAELPGTIDLQEYYGECPFTLDWATVTALSARFPIVTPAGRVGKPTGTCSWDGDLQLVDGGYIDNSGLGTLSDLSAPLAAIVLEYNATADGMNRPIVLPTVMFVSNEPGADLVVDEPEVKPELLIPLATRMNAPLLQTEPATWLARLSSAFANVCPSANAPCSLALGAVRAQMPNGVIVVAPSSRPALSVPLGWVLSDLSKQRLDAAVADEALCENRSRARAGDSDPAPLAYGCLQNLLQLLPSTHSLALDCSSSCDGEYLGPDGGSVSVSEHATVLVLTQGEVTTHYQLVEGVNGTYRSIGGPVQLAVFAKGPDDRVSVELRSTESSTAQYTAMP